MHLIIICYHINKYDTEYFLPFLEEQRHNVMNEWMNTWLNVCSPSNLSFLLLLVVWHLLVTVGLNGLNVSGNDAESFAYLDIFKKKTKILGISCPGQIWGTYIKMLSPWSLTFDISSIVCHRGGSQASCRK